MLIYQGIQPIQPQQENKATPLRTVYHTNDLKEWTTTNNEHLLHCQFQTITKLTYKEPT